MAETNQTQHTNIAQALAAAQMEMGKALKKSSNPHFKSKYADLASVVDACLPALNAHGIAVIQPVRETELGRYVATVFVHEGGEQLECSVPLILGKQDMQGLGSAITYARRFGLMSLAGIAPEDDDGNAAAMSAAVHSPHRTWAQTITDELPPGATERDKAEAVTSALMKQWQRKKTAQQLQNEWERRTADKTIPYIQDKFPNLFADIVDSYESQMRVVSEVTEPI